MRGFAIMLAVLGAGCDLVFTIDVADPSVDEDLDRVLNVDDNCPGIANTGQEDGGEQLALLQPDRVGDACDPETDTAGDAIVASFFFNDPLTDQTGWTVTGPWVFDDGFVEVDARGTVATLQSPALAQVAGEMTVEAGFEPVDFVAGSFKACTDVADRCVEVAAGAPPLISVIDELKEVDGADEINVALPTRSVLQLRRIAGNPTKLKGSVRNLNDIDKGGDVMTMVDSAHVFIVVENAHLRVHHVLIYAR